ncbi:MAG: hypothetical protein ACJAR8_000076 [Bacteroidia bacterium]|jgi:hypothetical protein
MLPAQSAAQSSKKFLNSRDLINVLLMSISYCSAFLESEAVIIGVFLKLQ